MASEPASIRDHILEAAEALIRSEGLTACTTRAIALRAGCSEGSIYRHFADKQALVTEIVRSRFPAFLEVMHSLPDRAGTGTVAGNLAEVTGAALRFHRAIMPLVVGPMNDHELLLEQRRRFHEHDTGPMRMFADLDRYLRAEQELGRISAAASTQHVTRIILGTSFAQAFVEAFIGEEAVFFGNDEEFVSGLMATLLPGLDPT